jgi:hypothetical protein
MTMMAVDESSDLMGEVAEVAYHLSLHNCRGVVTSLLHLGLSSLYVPYSVLLISNKICNRGGAGRICYLTALKGRLRP